MLVECCICDKPFIQKINEVVCSRCEVNKMKNKKISEKNFNRKINIISDFLIHRKVHHGLISYGMGFSWGIFSSLITVGNLNTLQDFLFLISLSVVVIYGCIIWENYDWKKLKNKYRKSK